MKQANQATLLLHTLSNPCRILSCSAVSYHAGRAQQHFMVINVLYCFIAFLQL